MFLKQITKITHNKFLPILILFIFLIGLYYNFFLFGKIPFPGDLLVSSYSPWFDYYKLPVKNPIISDIFSQIFLWKNFSIEQIKNLNWPLWNPYSFTGNPLLANYQSAVLYPLNVLLLLPKHLGWGLFIFSQTLIASIGMYLFLSVFLDSKLARIIGSITFALSGLNTTWVELGTAVHAISWLPLSLYFIEKFKTTYKYRYLLFLSFCLTLIILAGFAQIVIYSFIIIFIYGLLRINFSKFTLIPFVFSFLLALGLTAPQIFPSLDLLKDSIRTSDSYIEGAMFGLLPLKDFLKFFQADYFGNITTGNYWGSLNYIENSLFIGTLNLPLLIFSFIFLRKNKVIFFFLILFIFSLVLVFQNPLSILIYKTKIPLLTLSYASRLLFITTFSATILCSFALNQLINQQFKHFLKCLIWSFAALIGIILGTILVYLIIDSINILAINNLLREFYSKEQDLSLTSIKVSFRNQVLPLLQIVLLIIVILTTKVFWKDSKKVLFISLVLAILTIFDLSRYFLKVNPFVDNSLIFPATPSLTFLQKQPGVFRIGRENAEVLPPNTWMAYNLQSFEGYDPIYLNNYSRFINLVNNNKLEAGGFGRYAELTQKKYDSPYLNITNVKYLIGILRDKQGLPIKNNNLEKPEEYLNYLFKQSPLKIVFHDKASVVLENPNVLERAYFAKSVIYADNQQNEQDIINNKFNPKEQVVLTTNLGLSAVSGKGIIQITDYQPNQIKLTTSTSSDEILVLSDQFEKGWKAEIDGKETTISKANIAFRAIRVPAGNHAIRFIYWPQSFELGLKTLSLSIILILFAITAFKVKRIF